MLCLELWDGSAGAGGWTRWPTVVPSNQTHVHWNQLNTIFNRLYILISQMEDHSPACCDILAEKNLHGPCFMSYCQWSMAVFLFWSGCNTLLMRSQICCHELFTFSQWKQKGKNITMANCSWQMSLPGRVTNEEWVLCHGVWRKPVFYEHFSAEHFYYDWHPSQGWIPITISFLSRSCSGQACETIQRFWNCCSSVQSWQIQHTR